MRWIAGVADYLLDTNVVIALLAERSRKLQSRLAVVPVERLRLSTIVIAELRFGASKSRNVERAHAALDILAAEISLLDFDAGAARAYGEIRAALESTGATIGPMDLLIAAQAVAHGLTLVSDNQREFKRVPRLRTVNWIR